MLQQLYTNHIYFEDWRTSRITWKHKPDPHKFL